MALRSDQLVRSLPLPALSVPARPTCLAPTSSSDRSWLLGSAYLLGSACLLDLAYCPDLVFSPVSDLALSA